MGKNKKFKSFAEETSREIQDLKAQVGSQLIQVLKSEERVEKITEKCLKQLKESAGNTLGDFAKALSDHEVTTSQNLKDIRNRVDDISGRLSGRVNQLKDVEISRLESKVEFLSGRLDREARLAKDVVETLTHRLNELEQLVMMGRAKPKKKVPAPLASWSDADQEAAENALRFDEVANAAPKKDDPITAELKGLQNFLDEKKKQGEAKRAKEILSPNPTEVVSPVVIHIDADKIN